MANRTDVLLKMCDEHATQARQHENQRERITNYILVILGILVTFVSNSNFAAYSIPASMLLIILGIYGYMFSNKHYERNRLHVSILNEFLKEIDKELNLAKPQQTVCQRSLDDIRKDGEKEHYGMFPKPANAVQKEATSLIARRRLNPFWSWIPLLSVFIGSAFLIITVLAIKGIILKQTPKPIEVKLVK